MQSGKRLRENGDPAGLNALEGKLVLAVNWFVSRSVPRLLSAPTPDIVIARSTIVALLVGSIVVVAMLMHHTGLSIDPRALGTRSFALVFAILGAIRWFCREGASAASRTIRDMAEYFGLFSAITLVGAVASYPVAAETHGFVDPLLQRVDLALHFHWLAWYETVAAHPLLQLVSCTAYAMIYVSPAILIGYLAITDQRREAHQFIVAVWLAATITLVLFRFMPAVGPFAYLWHGPIRYMPVSDLWQPQLIPQLRDHTIPFVDLGHLVGLVSAPSFHAAAAVLLIAFAWRQPPIRWPLFTINGAMLLATPVEGTHYLTDMILGAVVALVSFCTVTQLHPWLARMPIRLLNVPARASA